MRPEDVFIGQPVRSLQTMLRVISKHNNAIPMIIPDGIYGPTTMQAVTAFQRNNQIPATGITDQYTWEKIYDAYEIALIEAAEATPIEILIERDQVFRLNDSSPYIYLVQSILTQLSKDHPTINAPFHTGILDNETSNALREFQILAGLSPSGELDKETWNHLSKHFTLNVHHNTAHKRN